MTTPPAKTSALDWPAEWARDEKFWREVATRTVAGVLTLVVVGVPSVIYLWSSGGLRANQAVPILIGVAMVGVLALVWWLTRLIVRLVVRWRTRRALGAALLSGALTYADMQKLVDEYGTPEGVISYGDLKQLTDQTRKDLRRIAQVSRIARTVVPLLASVLAFFISIWLLP